MLTGGGGGQGQQPPPRVPTWSPSPCLVPPPSRTVGPKECTPRSVRLLRSRRRTVYSGYPILSSKALTIECHDVLWLHTAEGLSQKVQNTGFISLPVTCWCVCAGTLIGVYLCGSSLLQTASVLLTAGCPLIPVGHNTRFLKNELSESLFTAANMLSISDDVISPTKSSKIQLRLIYNHISLLYHRIISIAFTLLA